MCYITLPTARSCADWNADNKDNECKPSIPAGLKRPPPSKTTSLITWFEAHSTRQARGSLEDLREVFGLQAWDPVRQCHFISDGMRSEKNWRVYRQGSKRHQPKESWIDETGRRSDPTRNETSGPALRTPGTRVEATPEKGERLLLESKQKW